MVEECDRPDKEKRMTIMENLKGPALKIIQAVRFNNATATPAEYINAIENTFGTPETGEELYFTFRLLGQHPGEKLSEFLRRMERVLNKVVKKGGLPLACVNRARLEQLIKGATGSDIMVLSLRLRERRDDPPAFLQLLNEILTEEEYQVSRSKISPMVKSVHVQGAVKQTEPEMKELREEIKMLRLQVTELTAQIQMTFSAAAVELTGTLPRDVKTQKIQKK